MSILRIIIIIFALAISIFAQNTPRNLLSGKFTVDDVKQNLVPKEKWFPFPKSSLEWENRLPENVRKELIQRGESVLTEPIPRADATVILEYVRTGNRSNFEKISFGIRQNLMKLILAETIENKGRFTDKIANYVWAICEETYWGVPAHLAIQKAKSGLPDAEDSTVDLFTAETSVALALTDYFVGEKLDKVSPLLRKRIYSETSKKLFEPMKDSKRYSWLNPARAVNNWNPWIISNAMATLLLLEKDETKRAETLFQYMKHLDIYLNGLGEEGGCDEGPSYWFAAGASVFDGLEILDSATNSKIRIYDAPLVHKMASYIYKMHIADDYFVNFADADPKFQTDGILLYRFGKALNDKDLSNFGSNFIDKQRRKNMVEFTGKPANENGFFKIRNINNLLYLNELSNISETKEKLPDAWLADIQVMTSRSKDGLFLATHAGHNDESHNHNDVGDFIVYYRNEPIIIDAGRGNYTSKTFSSKRYELWFTQSEYHNLPIINGLGQSNGKAFRAENVKQSQTQGTSSLSMDIANSYNKNAGIIAWNRLVSLDKNTNIVKIKDDYSLEKQPDSLQQVFMTVCEVNPYETGKIKLITSNNQTVILNYDAKQWKVSLERPSFEGPEYSSFKTKWDGKPMMRIVLTARNPLAKDTLNYSINIAN